MYLRLIAQVISHRPAMSKKTTPWEILIKEISTIRIRVQNHEQGRAPSRSSIYHAL